MRGAGARGLDRGLLPRMKPKYQGSVRCVRAKASPGRTNLPSPTRKAREKKWRATATSLMPSRQKQLRRREQLEEPASKNTKFIERLLKTASNFGKQMNSRVRHLI